MGWVWFALVVAALGVFAWLGRGLFRRARALLREVSRAGSAAERLGRSGPAWASPGASMYDDDVELRARVARLRARRGLRRAERLRRHQGTWARWRGVE